MSAARKKLRQLQKKRKAIVEVWKQCPIAINYEVSDQGRVRRAMHTRRVAGTYPGRVLKSRDNGMGYEGVNLCVDNKHKYTKVHILVAVTFLGPRPVGCEVHHKDCNRKNNRLDNLKYITVKENREKSQYRKRLTPTQVRTIRKLRRKGLFLTTIADRTDTPVATVSNILAGRIWTNVD